MKKFKKIIAMGCAAIMACSVMSISAFAAGQKVTYSNDIALVTLGDESQVSVQSKSDKGNSVLKALGSTVVVEEDNVCKQLIQLNEYGDTYTCSEVSPEGIILKDAMGTQQELVPYYFGVSDISNVRATIYPVYVIWHYDVRLRSSASNSSNANVIGILDYNTYFRGHSNSGSWVYGQVLNNNLAGRVGYVHNSLLNLAPDGNPYE